MTPDTYDQNGNPTPTPDKQVSEMSDAEYQAYLQGYRDRDSSTDDQQPGNPDEPQETPAEHATEGIIGREVKPAPRPRRAPAPKPRRAPAARQPLTIPAKMLSMNIPDMTNAGAMMRKAPPRSMVGGAPRITKDIYPAMGGNMFNFDMPKRKGIDPFKGLDGSFGKAKALPAGMRMFGKGKSTPKKKPRFIW